MGKNLLIVNSSLPDTDIIVSSLRENVDVVFYNQQQSYLTLLDTIKQKRTFYTEVGFMFHNSTSVESEYWLNSCERNIVLNVAEQDSNLNSWSNFTDFLKKLKIAVNFRHFDLVTCNAYDNDWKHIITTLKQKGFFVRASVNVTGLGGDWILESDNIDMTNIYFTDNIYNWKHSLVNSPNGSNFLVGNDNSLYGFGSNNYMNLGKNTLFSLDLEEINLGLPEGKTVKKMITTQQDQMFALMTDGTLYARGDNRAYNYPVNLGVNEQGIVSTFKQCVKFSDIVDDSTTNSSPTTELIDVSDIWVTNTNFTYVLTNSGEFYMAGNAWIGNAWHLYDSQLYVILNAFVKVTRDLVAGGYFFGKGQIIDIMHNQELRNFGQITTVVTNDNGVKRILCSTSRGDYFELILPAGEEIETCTNSHYFRNVHLVVVSKTGRLYFLGNSFDSVNNPSLGFMGTTRIWNNGPVLTAELNTNVEMIEISARPEWPTGKRVKSFYTKLPDGYREWVKMTDNSVYAIDADGFTLMISSRNESINLPSEVLDTSLSVVQQISNGNTYILMSNGNIWAAGANDNGQFGVINRLIDLSYSTTANLESYWYKLKTIPGKTINKIFLTNQNKLMLGTTDDKIYYRGRNNVNFNTTGTVYNSYLSTPTQIDMPAGKTIKNIVNNYYATIAVMSDGTLYGAGSSKSFSYLMQYANDTFYLNYQKNLLTKFTQILLPFDTAIDNSLNRLKCKQAILFRNKLYCLMTTGDIYMAADDSDMDQRDANGSFTDPIDGFRCISKKVNLNGLIPIKLISVMIISSESEYTYDLYILMSNGSLYTINMNPATPNTLLNYYIDSSSVKVNLVQVNLPSELLTPENRIVNMEAGKNHYVIQMKNGEIATFGYNNNGQLMINATPQQVASRDSLTKVTLPANTDIVKVACGDEFTILLARNGKVYGNGNNTYGQLTGSNEYEKGLIELKLNGLSLNASDIYVGNSSTIIKMSNGDFYACGNNSEGQLGLGSVASTDPESVLNRIRVLTKVVLPADKTFRIADYETAGSAKRKGLTFSELISRGYTMADVLSSGVSVSDAINNGYSSFNQLKSFFGVSDLLSSGFSRPQVLSANLSVVELKNAGFSPSELLDASYSRTSILDAGYGVSELLGAKFEISEISKKYTIDKLIEAGLQVPQLLGYYDLASFSSYNYSVAYLKQFGYEAKHFKTAGFAIAKILDTANVKFPSTQLKEANYTVAQLKQYGYSAAELVENNAYTPQQVTQLVTPYSLAQLKAANISPLTIKLYTTYADSDIVKAGFSVLSLKQANIPATTVKNAVDVSSNRLYTDSQILSAGFSPSQLFDASYSVSDLKSNNYKPSELKGIYADSQIVSANYDISLLKNASYLPSQIYQYYTIAQMRPLYTQHQILSAGIDASLCRLGNYSVTDMRPYYSPLQLRNGGYADSQILQTTLDYKVSEYKEAGYTPTQLKAYNHNEVEILKAGFDLNLLVDASYGIGEVRPYYGLEQIKANYSNQTIVSSLAELNFGLADLIANGFGDILTVPNMRNLYTAKEIKDTSSAWIDDIITNDPKFPASQMLEADFNVVDISFNYTPNELRLGGYTAVNIWSIYDKATYTLSEMRQKTFTAKELIDNGFNSSFVLQGQYSVRQLREASIGLTVIANAVDDNSQPLYTNQEIVSTFTLAELKNDEYSVAKIMEYIANNPNSGLTRLQVVNAKFLASNMRSSFTPLELKTYNYSKNAIINAGYQASELVSLYDPVDLLTIGSYSKSSIVNAGYSIAKLRTTASLELVATDLKQSTKYGTLYTDANIISAGFNIQMLKDADYSPSNIVAVTNSYDISMLTVGYSLSDLNSAGYTPKKIIDGQTTLGQTYYSKSDIGNSGLWQLSQLKEAGYTPTELKTYVDVDSNRRYSDEEIVGAGYSITLLKDAGFTPVQLLDTGLYEKVDIIKARFAVSLMYDASQVFTPTDLKVDSEFYTVSALKTASYSDESIIAAKYPVKMMKDALYTIQVLKQYGFKPVDLRDFVTPADGFSDAEILAEDYTILEFKQGKFTVSQVKSAKGYTDKQLKEGGFTADDFDKSGYSLTQLISYGQANGAKFKQSEIFTVLDNKGFQKYTRSNILNCGLTLQQIASLRGTSAAANDTQIPLSTVYYYQTKTLLKGEKKITYGPLLIKDKSYTEKYNPAKSPGTIYATIDYNAIINPPSTVLSPNNNILYPPVLYEVIGTDSDNNPIYREKIVTETVF